MQIRRLCALLVLCVLLCPTLFAEASGPTGPRFTWSSFQRFWDKQAIPSVYLTNPETVQGGYLIHYGHGVTLRVLMHDKAVTGVEARFSGGPANDAGGMQFKRLIYQSIIVGTYRWPEDKIVEVRQHFSNLSPMNKDYRYQMTHFRYTYNATTGWTFGFDYVPLEDSQK